MSDAATKTCNKCGEAKAVELFVKGVNTCKWCRNLYVREFRKANPEIARERDKRSRQNGSKAIHMAQKRYTAKNPERQRAASKRYRLSKPETVREIYRRWFTKNANRIKQKKRELRHDLSDWYVREKIKRILPGVMVSPELIEVKRKHLQLVRKLKEMNDER